MTGNELERLRKAAPFRPFSLHLADGRAIMIRTEEFLSYKPPQRTFYVYENDGSYEAVDLLLVVSATVAPLS